VLPGLYDLLPRPTVACSSEIGQLWHLPEADLGDLVAWEPTTFRAPPSIAFVHDWQTPRPAMPGGVAAWGDYPIRLAYGEQPDGTRAWIGMLLRDLLTAMIISAPMGTGKTHMAKNLLSEVLRVGAGASVTDFKADLVTDILRGMIPRAKEQQTLLIDLADTAWPVAINPLHQPHAVHRGMIADSLLTLISRFDATFADGVGMQEFARNAALALLEASDAASDLHTPDLLHVHRFMRSEAWRLRLVEAHVHDPLVREFWLDDFPRRGEAQRNSVDALVRRLGMFLMQPVIRNVVCRPRTTLDYRAAMDHGQIVLASLPVEVISNQIGAFAALMLQELLTTAAFSRSADHVPVANRAFFLNLIDEFQQAVQSTDPAAVATQISKMRAMGVGNVYLYQASAQIPADLREQIESTVANAVCLGALGGDIPNLLRRWGTYLQEADLVGMRRREDVYMQVQVNEERTPPFRAIAAPLFAPPDQPSLPAGPSEAWEAVRAARSESWHRWMDERIDGITAYEREATRARDEAARHRSFAKALRRGDLAKATEQRDSWQRSRTAWPDDAQAHLKQAEQLDAQAKAWERTPLELLRAAPPHLFDLYRQRRAEHRTAQRAFLIQNPGAISDTRERIIWLSRLQLAEPALDVTAYIERTVRDLSGSIDAAGGGRGSEGRGRAHGRADRNVRNGRSGAAGLGERGAEGPPAEPSREPWKEDQRSVNDVIDGTMPPFLSLSHQRGKPRYDREV
jgi:hypothetical protein